MILGVLLKWIIVKIRLEFLSLAEGVFSEERQANILIF
jgi:hypothetical protein